MREIFLSYQQSLSTLLRKVVLETDTVAGRSFDMFIQGMIVLSLISFSVETLPGLSSTTRYFLYIFEVLSVSVFTIEYLLRVMLAPKPLRFMFSFFGIVDLLAILPFYLAVGIDLRSVRVFRMLRLFRIFKIMRYGNAINRFHRALVLAREELIMFFSATLILLFLSGVGIYYFERTAQPESFSSVFHSIWWAVATLTTVGYGDVYPVTVGGRIFTFIILMAGLGIVSIPPGLLAAALTKAREEERKE